MLPSGRRKSFARHTDCLGCKKGFESNLILNFFKFSIAMHPVNLAVLVLEQSSFGGPNFAEKLPEFRQNFKNMTNWVSCLTGVSCLTALTAESCLAGVSCFRLTGVSC